MQPSECGTRFLLTPPASVFKPTNDPQVIALLFLLEMAPASEGGRYMRMYPEKAIEALIVIPAERKSTLTGTVEYDSQPPVVHR